MNRPRLISLTFALFGALIAFPTVLPSGAEAQTTPIPITIESTPPGATVYLDSTSTPPLGVTPLQNVRLRRGQATFIFQLENHEEERLVVDIKRRREVFRAVLKPLSTIVVTAGNSDAEGAAIRIDGEPVGNVPFSTNVKPGRHLVQVGREGFKTFSQWVDLASAQSITVPVLLEREAPRTGALLVVGDSPGAKILIDGEPKGETPQLIEGIPEGERVVEIVSDREGAAPYRETIRVIAGERFTLNPTLIRAAEKGSLRIFTNVRGAMITVNGEPVGESPVTVEGLAPGEHLVEATHDDYQETTGVATVEAGKQAVLQLRMAAVERAPGRVIVNADVAKARVFVDNEERGEAPVVVSEIAAGTHAIRVVAPGRQEFRTTCNTAPGQDCEINAVLAVESTPVRIEANVAGAQFYLNDDLIGPVPWEGELPIGSHRFEIRAEDYRPHSEVIALRASDETRVLGFALVGFDQLTPEEERALERERQIAIRSATSHGAAVLPADLAVLDVGLGYLPMAHMKLGVGIMKYLEAGFAFRTMGRLNQFELSAKAGVQPLKQLSVGGRLTLGGGLGPKRSSEPDTPILGGGVAGAVGEHKTNAFYVGLDAIGTIHFNRAGAVSLWVSMDFHSDRWDWAGDNRSMLHAPLGDEARQNMVRGRIGGALEFTLNKRLNIWGTFEGVLGKERRIYGNVFLSPEKGRFDPQIYTMLGITLKFGSLWDEDELE